MTALVQKNHGWLLSSTADDAVCGMPQSPALNTCTVNETDEATWHCGQLQDGRNLPCQGECQIISSEGNPTLYTNKIQKSTIKLS